MLRLLERLLLILGASLLSLSFGVQLYGDAANRASLEDFDQAAALVASARDQHLWSAERRAAYARSLQDDPGLPAAVLTIESIGLRVPVFTSTKQTALNRGIGVVEGGAMPGAIGNIALAGHRDGFFRGLKDIAVGDSMEFQTLAGTQRFRVAELMIVDPLDVSVLEPTEEATLTLITCFPFYYVGFAPERFVVRGSLEPRARATKPLIRSLRDEKGLPG